MHKAVWLLPLWLLLIGGTSMGWAGQAVLEYPSALLDIYDADQSCWDGMDEWGDYPRPVTPERWLVGTPPSELSAVTLPMDHWVDLLFSGQLVDGAGSDIVIMEAGRASEQALLFLTDGADREYLLTKVAVNNLYPEDMSRIEVDLAGVLLPFAPRAVRLLAVDLGGLSPGFDLGSMRARISHDCGTASPDTICPACEPTKACFPNPISGAVGVGLDTKLTWSPGSLADEHVVYFDTAALPVRSGAPAVRYPAQPRDANVFEPPQLRLGETYYWRVDELGAGDANQVYRGDVWSFTVSDHVVVDDFETYTQGPPIYEVWQPRGWTGVSLEKVVFDTCQYSMILGYYYSADSRSELLRRFTDPQDWMRGGATILQLIIHGDLPDPTSAELYVALTDGVNEYVEPCPSLLPVEGKPKWYVCRLVLADVGRVDLTRVRGLAIGVRAVPSIPPGVSHRASLGIAEIRLYRALCLDDRRPSADLTADCAVDYRDLERMALEWLDDRTPVYEVAAPNEPVLWYEFDGSANDSADGAAHGQVEGRVNYVPGVYGQAIRFMNQGDRVTIPQAARVFARLREAITITFWQFGEDSTHRSDTICCSDYTYGQSNPAIAIHLGCWRHPGHYRWDCGRPWSFENRVAGRHRDKSEWAGRWNHWAFTKDIRVGPEGEKGRMEIYLNGALYDRLTGTDTPITGISSFEIGSGWYGYYDGRIDDFQIFDYALSPAEIAYVATDGTGVFRPGPSSPADLDASDLVDLRDFSILATEWLHDGLWP